jgi:hypothetical protein
MVREPTRRARTPHPPSSSKEYSPPWHQWRPGRRPGFSLLSAIRSWHPHFLCWTPFSYIISQNYLYNYLKIKGFTHKNKLKRNTS